MKAIPNDISRIEQYLEELKHSHSDIGNFLYELEKYSSFYFIGGFIRSVYNELPIRDIDIIYNPYNDDILLSKFLSNVHKNIFNGQRMEIAGITFDLWNILDNWAFKNKHYSPSFDNMQLGTFYNIDSLVYGYKEKILYCSKYNEAIETNTLDIINKTESYIRNNPTKELNIVKACIYKSMYNLNFSTVVNEYIYNWKKQCGIIGELVKEEHRHFKKQYLTVDTYYEILNGI